MTLLQIIGSYASVYTNALQELSQETTVEITAQTYPLHFSLQHAISIITYMETYQGVLRSPHLATAQTKFHAFLETVPVLPFSRAVAKRCAHLRETLKQEGKRVKARALDLMTAAIALEHGFTFVTLQH